MPCKMSNPTRELLVLNAAADHDAVGTMLQGERISAWAGARTERCLAMPGAYAGDIAV